MKCQFFDDSFSVYIFLGELFEIYDFLNEFWSKGLLENGEYIILYVNVEEYSDLRVQQLYGGNRSGPFSFLIYFNLLQLSLRVVVKNEFQRRLST